MPYKPDHINNLRDKAILENAQQRAREERAKEKAAGIPSSVPRHNFLKKALLKLGVKTPTDLADYAPATGFEMAAKNLILAQGRDGTVHVQVFREMRDALGERLGKYTKQAKEGREQPKIVNDLPFAELPPLRAEDDKAPN